MKCKLKRDCILKACTKRKAGCPYDYGPNDIPLTLSEGHVKRRLDRLRRYWRLICENQASYTAGFDAGLRSLSGTHASDIWSIGNTSDEHQAYRFGIDEALKCREDGEIDLARRARWESGAIRRGELSESEREYTWWDESSHTVRSYTWWDINK